MKNLKRFRIFASLFILCISMLFFAYCHYSSAPIDAPEHREFPTILIDAGHGGIDGGAVANDGTQEQYINLQIALELEKQLNVLGFRTEMTRRDQNSIHDSSKTSIRQQKISDIHNRMQLLNRLPNCILVSIHQNKFQDKTQWGTQVFYSPNTTESAMLADSIQTSCVRLLQPENHRKSKKSTSSIYLLYKAKKPAVLVECGFISNEEELKFLKDTTYQKQVAFAIAMGILNYCNQK